MEEQIQQVLSELERWGAENDARETERHKKMLNLEPDTARLLSILVRSSHSTRLLEIGTSNGYSTIWLAWSARQTSGHVTSIEFLPEKLSQARKNLERTDMQAFVTLLEGDASDLLINLQGPFDFVFLDADRRAYVSQFERLLPLLTPDALVLADNVHSHPEEIAPYLAMIEALPDFDHVVAGVGKGLSIAYRRTETRSSPEG